MTFIRINFCLALVLGSGALCSALAAPQASFERDIAAVTERTSLAPREALLALERIQATYAPLSPERQAHMYEQLSISKFHSKDYSGSLQYGSMLEALGKQRRDRSMETLGVLQQAYGNWKLGKISTAYAFVRRAEQSGTADLTTYARVKSLLTSAQLASEEGRNDEALAAAEQAVKLGQGAKDSAILFMATHTQAMVALSVGKRTVATKAMNELLDQSEQAPFAERRIRAKGVEFSVASYAGLSLQANQALAERLRLIRESHLDEALPITLVDYAGLQLRSGRYLEAEALSAEALQTGGILFDLQLSNSAHFIHAIASISSGRIQEGKEEFKRLFKSNREREQLLSFLPGYVAALTQAGDANASIQADAIRRKLAFEDGLRRAKVAEKSGREPDMPFTGHNLAKLDIPANGQYQQYLVVSAGAIAALFALVYLWRRRRPGSPELV